MGAQCDSVKVLISSDAPTVCMLELVRRFIGGTRVVKVEGMQIVEHERCIDWWAEFSCGQKPKQPR
jgi:hypothetical protein